MCDLGWFLRLVENTSGHDYVVDSADPLSRPSMSAPAPRSEDGNWRDAASAVEGAPTAAAKQRQRKSLNRRVALLVVVAVLPLAVVGVILATGDRWPELPRDDPSPLSRYAGLVGTVVGLVLTTIGVVRLFRAGMWGQAWRDPTLSLNRRQRRHLLSRIRRAEPVPDPEFAVATDLARRLARQGPLLFVVSGVTCAAAGSALSSSSPFLAWVFVAVVVGEIVVVVLMRRDIDRARRWLGKYAPEGEALEPPAAR